MKLSNFYISFHHACYSLAFQSEKFLNDVFQEMLDNIQSFSLLQEQLECDEGVWWAPGDPDSVSWQCNAGVYITYQSASVRASLYRRVNIVRVRGWQGLGHTGTNWDTLGQTGTYWDTLGHIETHWDILGHTGTHWDTMGHIETHWDTLIHTGTNTLGQNGPKWDTFGNIGLDRSYCVTPLLTVILQPSNPFYIIIIILACFAAILKSFLMIEYRRLAC